MNKILPLLFLLVLSGVAEARRHDPETGLQYFRGRYYDAELGRFLSRDPKGTALDNKMMRNRYFDLSVGNEKENIRSPKIRAGSPYDEGMNLYQAYFVPNHVDPSGMSRRGGGAGRGGNGNEGGGGQSGSGGGWTSSSFVNHYYTGNGAAVTLSQIGLLSQFQGHTSVTNFKNQVQQNIDNQASGLCTGGVVQGSFNGSDSGNYDVTGTGTGDSPLNPLNMFNPLYSLGNGSISATFSCTYTCIPCPNVSCSIDYSMSDSFSNPMNLADVGGFFGDLLNTETGTPFPITGSWSESYSP